MANRLEEIKENWALDRLDGVGMRAEDADWLLGWIEEIEQEWDRAIAKMHAAEQETKALRVLHDRHCAFKHCPERTN